MVVCRYSGVYDEDVIQLKSSKKLGIVIKTCRDDESSDDDSIMSDEEDDKVEPGKVMVGWYNMKSRWNDGEEVEIVDESSVKLVDRSLLPGDVVRWVTNDKGNQKGQVTNVSVLVDCHIIGTDHVLKDVDASRLTPLFKYVSMTPIVKGPWLGIIKAVIIELTLRLKNGSRCIISGDAINNISDVTDQREEDSPYYCPDFYSGQQVQSSARSFKEAKWISGTRPAVSNHTRLTAVVEDVAVDSLDVDWQVCGYTGSSEGSLIQPDPIITRTELNNNTVKVLTHFKEAHIQIGDKQYCVLNDVDVTYCKDMAAAAKAKKEKPVAAEAQPSSASGATASASAVSASNEEDGDDSDYDTEPTPRHNSTATGASARQVGSRPRRRRHLPVQKKKKRYQPPVAMLPGEKVCVEICSTRTVANTVWQDSKLEENVVSTDLYPVIHLDELEFFPGDFVVDTRMNSEHEHDLGVIQSTDFDARICTIKWVRFQNNHNATETSEQIEVDVSVYDIKDHEDYMFRAGDIVVRLSPNDAKASENTTALAPAGQIMKVNKDGKVQVLWVDASITCVLPSQLYVVNEEDLEWGSEMDEDDLTDNEWDEDEDEWETASDDDDVNGGNDDNEMNELADLGVVMRSLNELQTLAGGDGGEVEVIDINQRTAQFISALEQQFSPAEWGVASNNALVNMIGESSIANQQQQANAPTRPSDEQPAVSTGDPPESVIVVGHFQTVTMQPVADGNDGAVSMETESPCIEMAPTHVSFVSTEAVPDCHKYKTQTLNPHNPRTFNSAVMRDIKLLKKDLPPGITIKSFEDRIDLYSAIIRGPSGTPYEDGLFYFDIHLPDNYPISPPQVHYHSYCSSRLNPNLYEGGKVCVSLLGTWSGTGSEKWTSKSTLHQLLLSIQGLILNEEPYFNEAGYEKHRGTPEGKENSRMYNEMAVIKMLQSIQLMISRPPDIFKDEVIEHFKERLPKILERCDRWLDCDGTLNDYNRDIIPSYPLYPLSRGFCSTVSRILDNLRKLLNDPPFT